MTKTDSKKLRIEYVEWVDSNSSYGWRYPEDDDLPAKIKSVGILISEEKSCLTMSTSSSEGGRFLDKITIPKVAISKRRKLTGSMTGGRGSSMK